MQRYVCLMDERAINGNRNMPGLRAMAVGAVANRPAAFIPKGEGVPDGFVPAHEFDAAGPEDAHRYFRRMQDEGMPMDPSVVGDASRNSGDASRIWRFRGDRHYIKGRLPEFGLGDHNEKALQANPQWRQITNMLGQLCKQYHDARKQDGVAQLSDWQRGPIARSLEASEEEISRLGVLLAAAIDAQDAAYRAFGIDHRRGFRLAVAIDVAPEPSDAPHPAAEPNHPKRPHKPAPAAK